MAPYSDALWTQPYPTIRCFDHLRLCGAKLSTLIPSCLTLHGIGGGRRLVKFLSEAIEKKDMGSLQILLIMLIQMLFKQ